MKTFTLIRDSLKLSHIINSRSTKVWMNQTKKYSGLQDLLKIMQISLRIKETIENKSMKMSPSP